MHALQLWLKVWDHVYVNNTHVHERSLREVNFESKHIDRNPTLFYIQTANLFNASVNSEDHKRTKQKMFCFKKTKKVFETVERFHHLLVILLC